MINLTKNERTDKETTVQNYFYLLDFHKIKEIIFLIKTSYVGKDEEKQVSLYAAGRN